MRKKSIKLLSSLLCVILLIGLLSTAAFADGEDSYDFSSASETLPEGDGWSWDPTSNTLLLCGVNWDKSVTLPAGATLDLLGRNIVKEINVAGNLTIKGSGALEFPDEGAHRIMCDGLLTIEGGYLKLKCDRAGITAGSMNVTGGYVEIENSDQTAIAIWVTGSDGYTQSGGYVKISSDITNGYCMQVASSVTVSGGYLEVSNLEDSNPHTYGALTIHDGTGSLTNNGGVVKVLSDAGNAINGNIAVSSGVVIAHTADTNDGVAISGTVSGDSSEYYWNTLDADGTGTALPDAAVSEKTVVIAKMAMTGEYTGTGFDSAYIYNSDGYAWKNTSNATVSGGSYLESGASNKQTLLLQSPTIAALTLNGATLVCNQSGGHSAASFNAPITASGENDSTLIGVAVGQSGISVTYQALKNPYITNGKLHLIGIGDLTGVELKGTFEGGSVIGIATGTSFRGIALRNDKSVTTVSNSVLTGYSSFSDGIGISGGSYDDEDINIIDCNVSAISLASTGEYYGLKNLWKNKTIKFSCSDAPSASCTVGVYSNKQLFTQPVDLEGMTGFDLRTLSGVYSQPLNNAGDKAAYLFPGAPATPVVTIGKTDSDAGVPLSSVTPYYHNGENGARGLATAVEAGAAAVLSGSADDGYTLTLNGFNFQPDTFEYGSTGIQTNVPLTIAVQGTNTIGKTIDGEGRDPGDYKLAIGISSDQDITFTGSGTLNITDFVNGIITTASTPQTADIIFNTGDGFCLNVDDYGSAPEVNCCLNTASGNITLSSGTYNLTSQVGNCIYAGESGEGNVTIGDGNVTLCAMNSGSNGIYSSGAVTASGSGSVDIDTQGFGIYAQDGDVTVSGSGNVSIVSEDDGIYASNGDIVFSGSGNVIVSAANTGIVAMTGDVILSGSGQTTVTSTGDNAVYLDAADKKLMLNGTGAPLSFSTADPAKPAIYNSFDGNMTVGGSNLSYYDKIEISDDESSAVYDHTPFVYVEPENPFVDVKESDWFYKAVIWAIRNKIVEGTDPTHFSPYQIGTRAQTITFLWRAAGKPVVNYAMPFTDVDESAYYAEAVRWAVSVGITKGMSETIFGVDEDITREQFVTLVYNYAKTKGEGFTGDWMFLLDFDDAADISSWADEAMHWCVMKGIVQGVGYNLLAPQKTANRAEVVTMLYRFFTLVK